jgi:hypothetical protein
VAEKRVSVRISADGGAEVRDELRAIGQAGQDGMGQVGSGADQASGRLDAFAARAQAVTESVAGSLKALGSRMSSLGRDLLPVSAGITAAVTALGGMAAMTATAGNRIDKASQAAGLSAASYQELAYALGQVSDLSGEQIDAGLRKLNATLGQAATGNATAAERIAALGVSIEDVQSGAVGAEQVLGALIARLGEAGSAAEAAALAGGLLGEELGPRLGPALAAAGADGIDALREKAEALGFVMEGETVAASARFADGMDDLTRGIGSLRTAVGEELLPVLADTFIPFLTNTAIPALRDVIKAVASVADWFGELPESVQIFAGAITTALAVGGPVLLAVGGLLKVLGAAVAAAGPVGLFIAAAGLIYAAWQTFGDDIVAAVGPALDWLGERFDWLYGKIEPILDLARRAGEAIAGLFRSANAGTPIVPVGTGGGMPLGPQGIIGADYPFSPLFKGGMVGPSTGGAAGDVRLPGGSGADMLSDGIALGAALADGIAAGLQAGLAANAPTIEAALDGVTAAAETTFEVRSPSRVFAGIGADLMGGLAQGIAGAAAAPVAALSEVTGAMMETAQFAVGEFKGAFQSAFVGIVTGAKSVEEALGGLLQQLATILANKAFEALWGGLFGGGAGAGGFVAAVVPGLSGIYADGTDFAAGGLALVGERGPELVEMPRGARVHTAGDTVELLRRAGRAGQAGGVLRVVVEEAPGFAARVRTEAEGVAVAVVRSAAPGIVGQSVQAVGRLNRESRAFATGRG